MSHLPPPQDDVGQAVTTTVSPAGVEDSGGIARRLGGVLVSGLYRLLGRVQIDGAGGNVVTSTTDGPKERLDTAMVPGHALVDSAGIRAINSLFGDQVVAQRHGQIIVSFAHNLPSETLIQVERWVLSSVVGTFTVGELVMGGTSSAQAFIDETASPALFKSTEGKLLEGETITGQLSGATAIINKAGGAFFETVDSNLVAHSGTIVTTNARISSRTISPYQAGFGSVGIWTAAWPDGSAPGTNLCIGLLNEDDGFAVGFKGADWGVLHRRDGAEVSHTVQADFALDPLDGSGPSGYTIDTTRLNVFHVQYGFLGAVGPLYSIITDDLELIPFHFDTGVNKTTQTVVRDPQLPIAVEIVRTSGTTDFRIFSGSWSAGSLGPVATRRRKFTESAILIATATEIAMLIIRNKRTHHGLIGRAPLRLVSLYVSNIAGTNVVIQIRRNATYTGTPTFTDEDSINSVAEISTDNLPVLSGKIEQFVPMPANSAMRINLRDDDIELQPGDSYTFSVFRGAGQGPSVSISPRWEEDL